jgi:hypothetical protein
MLILRMMYVAITIKVMYNMQIKYYIVSPYYKKQQQHMLRHVGYD